MCLYKSTIGNTNVTRRFVTGEGVKLGACVNMQCTSQYWMATTWISTLDSISFDWDTTLNEWESTSMQLGLYKLTNGNISVPRSYVTKEGVKLGA